MAGENQYISHESQRELSPESSKFVPLVMPKGSIRRPAGAKSFNQLAGIAHIESLNPTLDISKLTKEWLKTAMAELPENVNGRLLRFIHEHDVYDLKLGEPRFEELMKELVRGSEIQDCEDYELIVLEPRLMTRLRHLSRNLSERCFIRHVDGKLTKTENFMKCWGSRETYWRSKAPAVENVEMTDEADESFDKKELPIEPTPTPSRRKGNLFSAKARAAAKLFENTQSALTPWTLSVMKKRAPDTEDETPIKRQQTTSSNTLRPTSPAQPSIQSEQDDHAIAEAVRFGKEFLSSPTPDHSPEPPAPLMPRQKKSSCETPTTPLYPDLPSNTAAHGIPSSRTIGSAQAVRSALRTPRASQRIPTPTPSISQLLPQISFIFQRPTGFYNLDDAMSASNNAYDFFSSSLSDFFQLAANKFSRIGEDEVECITVRYGFGGFEVEIVHIYRDSNLDDWDLLKGNIRRQFHNSRMLDPLGRHFDVLVGLA